MAARLRNGSPLISMFRASAAHKEAVECCARGELALALELFDEELTIIRRALGNHHLLTLRAQLALAGKLLSWEDGDVKAAHALFDATVVGYTALLGADHPKTKRTEAQRDKGNEIKA